MILRFKTCILVSWTVLLLVHVSYGQNSTVFLVSSFPTQALTEQSSSTVRTVQGFNLNGTGVLSGIPIPTLFPPVITPISETIHPKWETTSQESSNTLLAVPINHFALTADADNEDALNQLPQLIQNINKQLSGNNQGSGAGFPSVGGSSVQQPNIGQATQTGLNTVNALTSFTGTNGLPGQQQSAGYGQQSVGGIQPIGQQQQQIGQGGLSGFPQNSAGPASNFAVNTGPGNSYGGSPGGQQQFPQQQNLPQIQQNFGNTLPQQQFNSNPIGQFPNSPGSYGGNVNQGGNQNVQNQNFNQNSQNQNFYQGPNQNSNSNQGPNQNSGYANNPINQGGNQNFQSGLGGQPLPAQNQNMGGNQNGVGISPINQGNFQQGSGAYGGATGPAQLQSQIPATPVFNPSVSFGPVTPFPTGFTAAPSLAPPVPLTGFTAAPTFPTLPSQLAGTAGYNQLTSGFPLPVGYYAGPQQAGAGVLVPGNVNNINSQQSFPAAQGGNSAYGAVSSQGFVGNTNQGQQAFGSYGGQQQQVSNNNAGVPQGTAQINTAILGGGLTQNAPTYGQNFNGNSAPQQQQQQQQAPKQYGAGPFGTAALQAQQGYGSPAGNFQNTGAYGAGGMQAQIQQANQGVANSFPLGGIPNQVQQQMSNPGSSSGYGNFGTNNIQQQAQAFQIPQGPSSNFNSQSGSVPALPNGNNGINNLQQQGVQNQQQQFFGVQNQQNQQMPGTQNQQGNFQNQQQVPGIQNQQGSVQNQQQQQIPGVQNQPGVFQNQQQQQISGVQNQQGTVQNQQQQQIPGVQNQQGNFQNQQANSQFVGNVANIAGPSQGIANGNQNTGGVPNTGTLNSFPTPQTTPPNVLVQNPATTTPFSGFGGLGSLAASIQQQLGGIQNIPAASTQSSAQPTSTNPFPVLTPQVNTGTSNGLSGSSTSGQQGNSNANTQQVGPGQQLQQSSNVPLGTQFGGTSAQQPSAGGGVQQMSGQQQQLGGPQQQGGNFGPVGGQPNFGPNRQVGGGVSQQSPVVYATASRGPSY